MKRLERIIRWMPAHKQKPEEGEAVLVYDGENWWDAEHRGGRFLQDGWSEVTNVTHWARVPLPEDG